MNAFLRQLVIRQCRQTATLEACPCTCWRRCYSSSNQQAHIPTSSSCIQQSTSIHVSAGSAAGAGMHIADASGTARMATQAADISHSIQEPASGWMHRSITQKNNMSTAEYFEHKRKSYYQRMGFWTKVYYAAGLVGAGFYAYSKIDWDGSKAAAELAKQEKERELEAKRLEALPEYLSGKTFAPLDDDDSPSPSAACVFEGASPAEIEALAARYRQEKGDTPYSVLSKRWTVPVFDESDPFEGMSPEEIDEYMSKKAASKQ